jgi:NADPH2:quinone reductase
LEKTVRAIVFERPGGPDVLEPRDVDDLVPAAGEVMVDVDAAGVNFRDVDERNGRDAAQSHT